MSDKLGKNNNLLPILLLICAAAITLIYFSANHLSDNLDNNNFEYTEDNPVKQEEDTDIDTPSPINSAYSQDLKINSLEEYNHKTKNEIYNIRKKYVKESLFYTPNYEPSEDIFGQIVDHKPWWGLKHVVCLNPKDNTTGISNLSKYINNPNMLIVVGQSYTFHNTPDMEWFCNSEFAKYIPFDLKYDADKKMIIAKYKMSSYLIQNAKYYGAGQEPYYITLQGLNAKDLGYRYGKIYDLNNITMRLTPNASEHLYRFKDYIHLGYSCRKDGGCNNISPQQPELEFHINNLPAELTVGLRKTDTSDTSDSKYDFKYKIIFEEE